MPFTRNAGEGRPGGKATGVVFLPSPLAGEGPGERGSHQNAPHPLAGEWRPGGATAGLPHCYPAEGLLWDY